MSEPRSVLCLSLPTRVGLESKRVYLSISRCKTFDSSLRSNPEIHHEVFTTWGRRRKRSVSLLLVLHFKRRCKCGEWTNSLAAPALTLNCQSPPLILILRPFFRERSGVLVKQKQQSEQAGECVIFAPQARNSAALSQKMPGYSVKGSSEREGGRGDLESTLDQTCCTIAVAAQYAFKILMIHWVVQFALRIAVRSVLHRYTSQEIHRWKSSRIFSQDDWMKSKKIARSAGFFGFSVLSHLCDNLDWLNLLGLWWKWFVRGGFETENLSPPFQQKSTVDWVSFVFFLLFFIHLSTESKSSKKSTLMILP